MRFLAHYFVDNESLAVAEDPRVEDEEEEVIEQLVLSGR